MTVVLIFVSVVFSVIAFLEAFSADACGPTHPCNLEVAQAAVYVTPGVAIAAILLTVVLAVVFIRSERRLWAAPTLGIALVVVAFVVASIMNGVST
ncbi:MAG TPA: hypothetical protein VIJ76_01990 [Galbitalea sp.]